MTARIDRNRLFKILALDGQGSDAYLADQLEARIDEWLVESTAPASVEPVLDLDALSSVIGARMYGNFTDDDLAAAVERHVAPIIAAARQSTAPTDPAELAKDPKVAAAVLRSWAEYIRARVGHTMADAMVVEAIQLDPPEPVDPPMVDGQWRERPDTKALMQRENTASHSHPGAPAHWYPHGYWNPERYTDDQMRGCRVVPTAEVIDRLGLGGAE